ncbi:hypothetical protein C8Q78DRAFT_391220 [Trametes maxima]|nr:hypothetical protein C8Q78DRAFT_391220 [Trametes maxima]
MQLVIFATLSFAVVFFGTYGANAATFHRRQYECFDSICETDANCTACSTRTGIPFKCQPAFIPFGPPDLMVCTQCRTVYRALI